MRPVFPVIPGVTTRSTVFTGPGYLDLPAHVAESGVTTIRWALSWKERLLVLLRGYFWQQVRTDGAIQPVKLTTEAPILDV